MARNTLLPVLRWRQKYGNILDLMDMLNSGKQQKVIAAELGISRSELCKFIQNTFLVRFVVRPDIADALSEIDEQKMKRVAEARKEMAKILQLSTPPREAVNDKP